MSSGIVRCFTSNGVTIDLRIVTTLSQSLATGGGSGSRYVAVHCLATPTGLLDTVLRSLRTFLETIQFQHLHREVHLLEMLGGNVLASSLRK